MDKDLRQRLRDACIDRDKVFTAEITLKLLDALDEADKKIEDLESEADSNYYDQMDQ